MFVRSLIADRGLRSPEPAVSALVPRPTRAKVRRFPTSVAAWVGAFPTIADHATPLAIWTFQDPSSPVDDKVGAHDLVEGQALLYAQPGDTVPVPAPRLGVQLDTTAAGEFASAADAAFFDLPAAATRSLLVRFRHPDNGAAGRGVMGAGDNGAAARWGLIVNATTGAINARASDGATTVNATGGAADDNAFHDAALVWDPVTDDTLGVLLDDGAIVASAIGALASVDAATGIRIGACVGLQGQTGLHVTYAVYFAGKLTQADMVTFRTAK